MSNKNSQYEIGRRFARLQFNKLYAEYGKHYNLAKKILIETGGYSEEEAKEVLKILSYEVLDELQKQNQWMFHS